jgi:hypothetical protein
MPIAEEGPILPGHVQSILYMLASWSFDQSFKRNALETHNP